MDGIKKDTLAHYGTPRHSGRYPWGSGDNPRQRTSTFLSTYRDLHAKGLSDKEIADGMGITTTELRNRRSMESDAERAENISRAMKLKEKGYTNVKIGEMMGVNESVVRSWVNQAKTDRASETKNTADVLKKNVDEKGFIDVGAGVERELNISQTKLNTAVAMLKDQGYEVHTIKVEQATNAGQYTTVKVLAPPGTTWADVNFNKDKINTINEYSPDGGKTYHVVEYPKSMSSDRIQIRYGDEGGADKDGVIELRRNVDDISLGNSSYAQVRIAVDGIHYLKGMAMYSDDMPDGVDVIFNTNKQTGTPKEKVFKELKDDPDNPFGATIKANGQRHYIDADGNEQLSVINKLREEGDWDEYSRNLSSQMLSKQNLPLIKKQLDLSYADKQAEFDEICSLTNPAVKERLLKSFADDCDAGAEHLKAAPLPGQSSKVILPITSLKDNEIYAPSYANGEQVVLIRYPHGGTFEIPELTVNNKHAKAKSIMGNAIDAVGINSKVASRLSGADFDGDTVIVIPVNSKVKIKTSDPLKGLEGFDPKDAYPGYEGMKTMTSRQKGIEMGKVSNLITDMTLKGANQEEIARAVRHSMVVIDAEKHGLDYKKSEADNGIAALKEKYQGKSTAGASTLISKASSETRVNERKKFTYDIDPETGEKIYKETGRTYTDKSGKTVLATEKSTKMAEAKDARSLSSGTPQEEAYASYANKLKSLANQARKTLVSVKPTPVSPSAKETYKTEVSSLLIKLNTALKNAPKERKAQLVAAAQVEAKKRANPNMDKDDIKKASQQALATARVRYGASKKDVQIVITDKEWEAIQAGAVSKNQLTKILNNTDLDVIRQLATPRATTTISTAKAGRIKAMNASGYTIAEIADQVGVPRSAVSKYLQD